MRGYKKVLRTYSIEEIQQVMFDHFKKQHPLSDFGINRDTLINTQISINGSLDNLFVKIIAVD